MRMPDEHGYVDDPIERYLDQLLGTLPGSPRQVRHTLAEVETHLFDATSQARTDGLDEFAARAAAVQRMGPVAGVADHPGLGLRLCTSRWETAWPPRCRPTARAPPSRCLLYTSDAADE